MPIEVGRTAGAHTLALSSPALRFAWHSTLLASRCLTVPRHPAAQCWARGRVFWHQNPYWGKRTGSRVSKAHAGASGLRDFSLARLPG